jgi:hypothetical protein
VLPLSKSWTSAFSIEYTCPASPLKQKRAGHVVLYQGNNLVFGLIGDDDDDDGDDDGGGDGDDDND